MLCARSSKAPSCLTPPLKNLDRSIILSNGLCVLFTSFPADASLKQGARGTCPLAPDFTTPVRSVAVLELSSAVASHRALVGIT